MKNWKSVLCAVNLAATLSIDEMPMDFRSDAWWDEFWRVFGLQKAKLIKAEEIKQ